MKIIIICIITLGLIILFLKNRKSPKIAEEKSSFADLLTSEEEYNNATVNEEDFETKYFEGIQQGEKFQQFLVIGSQQDTSIIRSLLAADGIPSFIENENVNRMYGAGATIAASAFAIKLFILSKDYDKAYEIVCEYTKSKQTEDEDSKTSYKTVAAAVVTGLYFSPFPINSEQKGMGITILPKIIE